MLLHSGFFLPWPLKDWTPSAFRQIRGLGNRGTLLYFYAPDMGFDSIRSRSTFIVDTAGVLLTILRHFIRAFSPDHEATVRPEILTAQFFIFLFFAIHAIILLYLKIIIGVQYGKRRSDKSRRS